MGTEANMATEPMPAVPTAAKAVPPPIAKPGKPSAKNAAKIPNSSKAAEQSKDKQDRTPVNEAKKLEPIKPKVSRGYVDVSYAESHPLISGS
jgi:hypothetical protein